MATSAIFPTDLSTGAEELVAKEIHQLRPGVTLYFGGTAWKRIQVFGGFMWFPPDLKGRAVPHPWEKEANGTTKYVKADGRLVIKDRLGFVYPKTALGGGRGRPVYGALPGEDITAQLRFIVNKHPYIVWLKGDITDAAQIERARRAWNGAEIVRARAIMERRRKRVEEWRKNNPGVNPPPPSSKEAEAQLILDSDLGPNQWKAYACQFFDAHYDTFEELRTHMKNTHNLDLPFPEGYEPPAGEKKDEDKVGVVEV